jgi:hypothetical protein
VCISHHYTYIYILISTDSFHKSRLLPVENRPLRRSLDRFYNPNSILFRPLSTLLENGAGTPEKEKALEEERQQWRDEMLLEVSILESTMVRIQMLRRSNALERERYTQSKTKILETAQEIRDNMGDLRAQLEEAQRTLALRKEYDVLADKITNNRLLRPREDQQSQLEKLAAEIEELKEEGDEIKKAWVDRKEQFDRIVDEGKKMMDLISGAKDDGAGEGDDEEAAGARGLASHVNTPAYGDGGSTPQPGDDSLLSGDRLSSLRVASPSRTASRAASPTKQEDDVEMGEVPNTPAGQTNLTSEMEEGEAEEDDMDGVDGA